jgi:cyclic pyranopterin phosphate synthase
VTQEKTPPGFSHIGADGTAAMVDVSAKPVTDRSATARASISMRPETVEAIRARRLDKGDVFGVARLAGIIAAKRTAELIPLCHTIPTTSVSVDIAIDEAEPRVDITACAHARGQTGVEMEALTAAAVAALTVYDMCKSVDRHMRIGDLRLTHKSGGRSGTFEAP